MMKTVTGLLMLLGLSTFPLAAPALEARNPLALEVAVTEQPAPLAFGGIAAKIDRKAFAMVRDPSRPRIYATTPEHSVIVIDTESLTVTDEIHVGSQPRGMDISPDGSELYVANSAMAARGISVVDLKTLKEVRTLDVIAPPLDVAVGLGKLFILSGRGLVQVDAKTGDLQADSQIRPATPFQNPQQPLRPAPRTTPVPTPLPGFNKVMLLPGFPPGETGYVQPVGFNDPKALPPVAPFDVRIYGGMIRLSPNRKTLYYGNSGLSPSELSRFDVAGPAPLLREKERMGSNAQDLLINPDGTCLCYPCGGGSGGGYDITLIPADRIGGVIASLPVGAYPKNGAFSADGAWFYSAPDSQDEVKIYDVKKGRQKTSFKIKAKDIGRLLCDRSNAYLFAIAQQSYRNEPGTLVVYSLR